MTWPSFDSARFWCVSISAAVLLLLLPPPARSQNTLNVPANYPTIQSAINAANNGDTVLVAPGTYVENINFNGKAITVSSSSGPAATVIDGNHNGTVVTFKHSESLGSILNGFTIRNGYLDGGAGAGIMIYSASPTITSNVITGNHAADAIGIFVNGGSPLISNNTITNNDQTNAGDGGFGGGGIAVAGSNTSPANPQIIGNTITNNSVGVSGGGGISVSYFSSPIIRGNFISGNEGGGVSLDSYNSPVLSNNLILNNKNASLYVSPGLGTTVTVSNNTIVGDYGIFTTGWGQNANVTNNIIVAQQWAVNCNTTYSTISPPFSYNDVYSPTGIPWTAACDHTSNPGNISLDPLFINPLNNFHLQSSSPAVDAGVNSASNISSTDLDGSSRIVDGNADGSATVDMGAYELQPTTITWSPYSLTFDPQPAGTTAPPQTVTLTNTGANKLYLSVSTGAPFSETDDCGGVVPADSSCSISVTFAPASTVSFTGGITLRDNAPQNPQSISLSGTGGIPSATLTPSSLSFDGRPLGFPSPAQTVTLSNGGDGPLTISSIAASGDFSQTSNCAGSLAAGASCSINVTFTPSAGGTRQGTLTVTDNASGSPQTVSLTGIGLAPQVILSPTSLNFGNQSVGTTSAPQTVTLSNTGGSDLAISGLSISGRDFSQTNSCGATLSAGASCSITVTFTPTGGGYLGGTLTVTDNASGSPQTLFASGYGLAGSAVFSASYLAFGDQRVGTTSAGQTVTLSNPGTGPLTISSIVASGDFSQTNSCGSTLANGSSCVITVTFTPTVAGFRQGSLTVTSNEPGLPQTSVGITGTGVMPQAILSSSSLSFGGQLVGTSSMQTLTLSNPPNQGNASLTISSITASGDFSQTNSCGNTVFAGATCYINVTFRPTAPGSRLGTLTITDNASGSPQTVSLSGTGLVPIGALSPAGLSFADQVIGTASASQTATLSNTGSAPLAISGIAVTGDFAQTNSCGSTLAAGASCSITVTFIPTVAGGRVGTLTVSSNSSTGVLSLSLSGNGFQSAPGFDSTSLAFSNQVVGTKSGGKNVKLTANGPGPLVISSISVTGSFLISSNCPSSLNKGSNCNITVNFQPNAGGPASGAVLVMDNGLGSPQTISLSGNGLDFTLSASPTGLAVNAGQNATLVATAAQIGGSFNNSVNLTCSGLPAGSKCQFSPAGISPKTSSASSNLTIQTAVSTPSGSYTITIIGTSGSDQHSTTVTLTVN